MANARLLEAVPSETGIMKIVWRLDTAGSGGMNLYSFPLYIQHRYGILVCVSGSATVDINGYLDLGDVPNAANDFPPAGRVLLGVISSNTVSAGDTAIFSIPSYVNFVEPVVSNVTGGFVCYVAVVGTL